MLQIPVQIPLQNKANPKWMHVRCHDWKGDAIDEGDEVADWLSKFLHQRVRLVKYGGKYQLATITVTYGVLNIP